MHVGFSHNQLKHNLGKVIPKSKYVVTTLWELDSEFLIRHAYNLIDDHVEKRGFKEEIKTKIRTRDCLIYTINADP